MSISLIVHSRYEGGVGAVVTAGHLWRHSGRFDGESVWLRFRMSLVCHSTYLRDVKSVNLFFSDRKLKRSLALRVSDEFEHDVIV